MKHKFIVAITYVILYLIILLSIFAFSKVKEVYIDFAFYLLIIFILLIFSFFNQKSLSLKGYQIILTTIIVLVGFVSFYFSTSLTKLLSSIFKIDENITRIFYSLDEEFVAVYINNTFFSITLILALSYFIFSILIKLVKKIIRLVNHYKSDNLIAFYEKSTKSMTAYLTILLVIFGFLPLFIGLIEFEKNNFIDSVDIKEIIKNFNSVIFGGFVTTIIPYAYLLMEESKK